jgi:hypothetical protein
VLTELVDNFKLVVRTEAVLCTGKGGLGVHPLGLSIDVNHNAPSDFTAEQVMGSVNGFTERDLPSHFIQ